MQQREPYVVVSDKIQATSDADLDPTESDLIQALLDSVDELTKLFRERRPGAEITARDYARARGITIKQAFSALNGLVDRGELATELVLNDRHVTRVWWILDA